MASLNPSSQSRASAAVPATPSNRQLTTSGRMVCVVLGVLLLVLLVTAAKLEPDDRGYGTHEKLGFGQCFVVAQWQVRCPSCGMTTAWARLLDGDVGGALAANAGGVLLCMLAIFVAPWLLASGYLARWCYLRPQAGLVISTLSGVAMVVVFDWIRHTGLGLLSGWIP